MAKQAVWCGSEIPAGGGERASGEGHSYPEDLEDGPCLGCSAGQDPLSLAALGPGILHTEGQAGLLQGEVRTGTK